jgi:16S rRNA (guanine1207-N2)-methyltransferase
MNPPFHHGLHGGRQADPDLGRRFIQCAASTLVQGGKLLMVANRNLPYEETLNAVFRRVEKIADEAGYKVFEATR